MTQWSNDAHERIAAEIKRARGNRSAQWLADRTAALGYPVSRSQIANYESGRKKTLDIAELLILAAALNTAPVMLVYPTPLRAEVEVLPGVVGPRFLGAQWFSGHNDWRIERGGDGVTSLSDAEQLDSAASEKNTRALALSRMYFEAVADRAALINEGQPEENIKLIELYDQRIRELRKEIDAVDA